jgi:hypothetical protein
MIQKLYSLVYTCYNLNMKCPLKGSHIGDVAPDASSVQR